MVVGKNGRGDDGTFCVLLYRRLCDDEDDLSEVAAEAVPSQVRDWLALTFTRSMSSLKRSAQDKPKFRSVANVIRAGIMVDRSVSVHSAAATKSQISLR